MSRRSTARQAALQVLFEDDFNPQRSRDLDRQYILEQVQHDVDLADFAWWLVDGTRLKKESIDAVIETAAENWSVYRMSAVDRNIIRLAAFECQFGDTPKAVGIDEAVRLAKRFGGKESPAFINGILDQLIPSPTQAADENPVKRSRVKMGSSKYPPVADVSTPSNSEAEHGLKRFLKRKPT